MNALFYEGLSQRIHGGNILAPPGNKAVTGKNNHQPDVSGETDLLYSSN
jgi:hypothetical protein